MCYIVTSLGLTSGVPALGVLGVCGKRKMNLFPAFTEMLGKLSKLEELSWVSMPIVEDNDDGRV